MVQSSIAGSASAAALALRSPPLSKSVGEGGAALSSDTAGFFLSSGGVISRSLVGLPPFLSSSSRCSVFMPLSGRGMDADSISITGLRTVPGLRALIETESAFSHLRRKTI